MSISNARTTELKVFYELAKKSVLKVFLVIILGSTARVNAEAMLLNTIVSSLWSIQSLLAQIGPIISAVLFTLAGIFYAVGQMLPPEKRATFHTTAVNIVIGAIIVAVMSVASNGFALASANLLANASIVAK